MVQARLEKAWTDDSGKTYSAGESVDLDAATLAELQEKGIVKSWAGPTAPPSDTKKWAGPTTSGE
jgi:hypothetical protein